MTMLTPPRLAAFAVLVALLAGCNQPAAVEDTGGDAPQMRRTGAPNQQPGTNDIRGLMWSKLGHMESILQGMALGDLSGIRADAEALREVSEHAAWLEHDTVTYHVFSDQFRDACASMADHAERGMLDAVTFDFNELTSSCVACHKYVREERKKAGMSGSSS